MPSEGQVFEGHLDGTGLRIAIAASRFNDFIVRSLLDGARDGLRRHGVAEAATRHYDAVIALGAVIRGATGHYDLVAGQAASGITRAGLDTGVPVIFGVLTTETIEQAIERAGTKAGNKGYEAAMTAIELVDLFRQLPTGA